MPVIVTLKPRGLDVPRKIAVADGDSYECESPGVLCVLDSERFVLQMFAPGVWESVEVATTEPEGEPPAESGTFSFGPPSVTKIVDNFGTLKVTHEPMSSAINSALINGTPATVKPLVSIGSVGMTIEASDIRGIDELIADAVAKEFDARTAIIGEVAEGVFDSTPSVVINNFATPPSSDATDR